jgi:Ser/Thr protein kinase RdoA (MazF antagonist)
MSDTSPVPSFPLDAIRNAIGLHDAVVDARPLAGGYSHHVIALNDEYVVRIAEPARAARLIHEGLAISALQAHPATAPIRDRIPTVIAAITGDHHGGDASPTAAPSADWHALVIPQFRGANAFRAWLPADTARRIRWVTQFVTILRHVHAIHQPSYVAGWFGTRHDHAGTDWRTAHAAYLDDVAPRAAAATGNDPLVVEAIAAARHRLDALAYAVGPVFGHGDLHLHNVIVDGDTVTGVIDWEWAGATEPDADLSHLIRWALFPAHPADEDLEAFVSAADFATVPPAIWAAYPEAAATPDLEARMVVYLVEHDLHALIGDPDSTQARARLGAWLAGHLRHVMPPAESGKS